MSANHWILLINAFFAGLIAGSGAGLIVGYHRGEQKARRSPEGK